MKIIALTGNLASGKSTVAGILQKKNNLYLVDADDLAKELCGKKSPVLADLANLFGTSIIKTDGNLNRDLLRTLVFADKAKLVKLENILHPKIKKLRDQHLKKAREKNIIKAFIYVSPLILEKEADFNYDYLITIHAPLDLRIKRAIKRNRLKEWEALAIEKQQMPQEEKIKKTHFKIANMGNMSQLAMEVERVWQKIKMLLI